MRTRTRAPLRNRMRHMYRWQRTSIHFQHDRVLYVTFVGVFSVADTTDAILHHPRRRSAGRTASPALPGASILWRTSQGYSPARCVSTGNFFCKLLKRNGGILKKMTATLCRYASESWGFEYSRPVVPLYNRQQAPDLSLFNWLII